MARRGRLDGRLLALAQAPFGDRPARDFEPVREYDGETAGLPAYALLMAEPFLRKTAEDDPIWHGRWVSNVQHVASGQYLAAFHVRICEHRRKPSKGRKVARALRATCNCPQYFFVKCDTDSRSNVPISYDRLVCWAAGLRATRFSSEQWLARNTVVVHHDDAAVVSLEDGTRVKSDADPSLLTALTQREHRELHATEEARTVAAPKAKAKPRAKAKAKPVPKRSAHHVHLKGSDALIRKRAMA